MKSTFIRISIIILLAGAIVFCTSDSYAEKQWEEYYDNSSSTFFYDKESLHYPYKDENYIVAVWTKIIPDTYITHDRQKIGYFSDLLYFNCRDMKFRRREMLIYSDTGKVINRQMGIPTYYTIDPGSEAEVLIQKVCR